MAWVPHCCKFLSGYKDLCLGCSETLIRLVRSWDVRGEMMLHHPRGMGPRVVEGRVR